MDLIGVGGDAGVRDSPLADLDKQRDAEAAQQLGVHAGLPRKVREGSRVPR
jgi:hypothetical protein